MRDEIIIDVSPGGDVTLEVNGVTGPACKELTEKLEKALGIVTRSTEKREYRDVKTDNRIVNRR